MEIGKM